MSSPSALAQDDKSHPQAPHPQQGLPFVWTSARSTRRDAIKILFVAHSKFFLNDMPGLFVGMTQQKAAGQNLKVSSVYGTAYSLAHHLNKELAVQTITRRGPWDYVVLFEQSNLPESKPQEFVKSLNLFQTAIKAAGARTVLVENYDESSAQVRSAAKRLGGYVLPIGTAWELVRKRNPTLATGLTSQDRHHPSLKGTYLMSCVCFAFFLHRRPQDLPDELYIHDGKDNIFANAKEAQDLQQAAWDAVFEKK